MKTKQGVYPAWRAWAIVFLILFVLETAFIAWAWTTATEDIAKENECSINVCAEYSSYYYESGMCYCYDNGEIVKEEYVK